MTDWRKQIDEAILAGRWAEARVGIEQFWREQPTSATASFLVRCGDRLRGNVSMTSAKMRILRSFTLEPAVPMLRAAALTGGIDLAVSLSEFNAYAQEILDPTSPLYEPDLNIAVLAVATRDIAPDLWDGFTKPSIGPVIAQFENWITTFRTRSSASLIVHTLETPPALSQGILDSQQESSQQAAIAEINTALRRIAAATPGVYVLDFDALIARRGRDNWYDATKWLTVRMPMRAENLPLLAAEWMRYVHPLTGRVAKVAVVDLDNTLWGGVIGEDGMNGIQVHRDEHKGAPYWELQRALMDLQQRGILLAIASKNNPADALEAIDNHPGMLLRSRHFAATRIGWNPKSQGLREIASELNVGIDSLVFIDDNPVERQHVRMELPEVTVLELPAMAAGYSACVRSCSLFERLSLSAEDRERTAMYAAQAERRRMEEKATSVEDFYRSLEQQVTIAPVNEETLARVSQLTHKTNQFNLTTHRYNEAEIASLAADPRYDVLAVNVRDRFGDNGLVGVCITRVDSSACIIDAFLMSCRVIGRTVETAILAEIASRARQRGARRLEGWFLPTKKNAPAKDFYANHGFAAMEDNGQGTRWALDLRGALPECPPWISLTNIEKKEPVLA
jgi:FkbH-like protein